MMTTIAECDSSLEVEVLLVHAALAAAACATGERLEVHKCKRHLDSRAALVRTSCANFGRCLAGGASQLSEWTTSTWHSNIGKLSGGGHANNAGPSVPNVARSR